MKSIIPVLIVALLAGCYSPIPNKIVDAKATTVGIEITPGGSTPSAPGFRIGLSRLSYRSIPTSTNEVHSAPFATAVDADVKGAGAVVSEELSTFRPQVVVTNIPVTPTNASTLKK